MFYKNKKRGFSLIEIVVGLAVILLCLSSLISTSHISLKIINSDTKKIKAGFLAEEGIEALKSMRAVSWKDKINILLTSTNYYLFFDGNNKEWQITSTPVFTDSFERKFIIENVYRDTNDDIAQTGVLDANTKKITMFVSWNGGVGTTESVSAYITNIFNN